MTILIWKRLVSRIAGAMGVRLPHAVDSTPIGPDMMPVDLYGTALPDL